MIFPTLLKLEKIGQKHSRKWQKNGDDKLIIPDVFEDEDLNDWNWEHFANTSFTTAKSQNI